MGFKKENIKALREELTEILNNYSKASGCIMEIGSIKFNENSFKFTVNGVDSELPGEDVAATEFILHCSKYGFVPADLGRIFMGPKGDVYTITGLKKLNRKYPIIAENIDTKKKFKFSPDQVRVMLETSIKEEEVITNSEHIKE